MLKKKYLLLDIGNTFIKWGLLENHELIFNGIMQNTQPLSTEFSHLAKEIVKDIDLILIASVKSDDWNTRCAKIISESFSCDVDFVYSESSAFDVQNSYGDPQQLGVDRWVAMIAAYHELQSDVMVVDLGTAITIDAVDNNGHHLGGQIIPGIQLMLRCLDKETDRIKLPNMTLDSITKCTGMLATNTDDALVHGTFNAICGAIERMINDLKKNNYQPKVLVTGGDARLLLDILDESYHYRPNLVLEGLAIMAIDREKDL